MHHIRLIVQIIGNLCQDIIVHIEASVIEYAVLMYCALMDVDLDEHPALSDLVTRAMVAAHAAWQEDDYTWEGFEITVEVSPELRQQAYAAGNQLRICRDYLQTLLADNPDDFEEIADAIHKAEVIGIGDLNAEAYAIACSCNASNYMEDNAGDYTHADSDAIDFNGYCDPEVADRHAVAMADADVHVHCAIHAYGDCDFAVIAGSQQIVALSHAMCMSVVQQYISSIGEDPDAMGDLYESSPEVHDVMTLLGIAVANGEIVYADMVGCSGVEIINLLEQLDWELDYAEPDSACQMPDMYYITHVDQA